MKSAMILLLNGLWVAAIFGQFQPVTFTGASYRAAVGGTSGSLRTGQGADLMLSGFGFNKTGGPLMFNHCSAVGSDGTRLYLADRNNNRVLVWLAAPAASNTAPDFVLGQADFVQNDPGTGLAQLNWPCAVSAAPNGRVVVADAYNDRLLLWDAAPSTSGQAASRSLSLVNIAAAQGASPPWGWPWGVWTNGTKLACTATNGARILVWNSWPTQTDQAPDLVISHAHFGTPRTITSDGNYFIVDDHNGAVPGATGPNASETTFFFSAFPATASPSYDFAVTGARWRGCSWQGKLVLVGRDGMRIYNSFPTSAAQAPDLTVNGRWTSDGVGAVIAGGRLHTVSDNEDLVRTFSTMPASGTATPDILTGAGDLVTNPLLANYYVTNPVPATDGARLYVSSDFDRRLNVYLQLPDESGAAPDFYYALSEAPWASALHAGRLILAGRRTLYIWNTAPTNGEQPDAIISNNIGTVALQEIRGVALDGQYCYIADGPAQKVHVFSGIPGATSNPVVTLSVTGQPQRLHSDGTWLAVPLFGAPQSVKVYAVANLAAAPGTVQSAAQFLNIGGCLLAGGKLYAADYGANRVVGWNSVAGATANAPPDLILGDTSLADTRPETGRSRLFWPACAAWDGSHLWVGEFKFGNRLLRYAPGPGGDISLAPVAAGGGSIQVQFGGAAGRHFGIESSSDLMNWTSRGFQSLGSGSTQMTVDVAVPGGAPAYFLRAWAP